MVVYPHALYITSILLLILLVDGVLVYPHALYITSILLHTAPHTASRWCVYPAWYYMYHH